LIIFVWEGSVTAENNAGLFDIGLNRAARIRDQNSAPEFITTPPVFTEPRPDEEDIDMDDLFGEETEQAAGTPPGEVEPESSTVLPAGLYIACYDSACRLTLGGQMLDLNEGKMGLVSFENGQLMQFEEIDPLLVEDTYFMLIEQGRFEETTLYELVDGNIIAENAFECFVVGK
jgi:hypothetical protein